MTANGQHLVSIMKMAVTPIGKNYLERWSKEKFVNGNTNVDFTKWFHDLYRPNHRPYDPREIELIKHFCSEADKDFEVN